MNTKPILLVEDNPNDEMFVLRAFKKNNVANRVIVARDGQEALDYLFKCGSEIPAIILLDLKLPKVSGLEVLKRLRADKRTNFIPVIILTSSIQDSDLRASYGLGGNSYILKSMDLDRFTFEMGLLAKYWLELNKHPSQ